tara:strand:- start:3791 stop:3994 length:204 start_codon:yes stop_codon:yes gene_type:complete
MILPVEGQMLSVRTIAWKNDGKYKRRKISRALHSDPKYTLCDPLEVGSNKKFINVWKLSVASSFIVV